MKDITVSNIKNWRREIHDKDACRKTINRGVTYGIVHTDFTRIVREHKERAVDHRAREELMHHIPKNTTTDHDRLALTTDDTTCTQCGRICNTIFRLLDNQITNLTVNIYSEKAEILNENEPNIFQFILLIGRQLRDVTFFNSAQENM
ncbi:unnamed protein product [Rotaria sp. Silwood2]|nr:unnamed protein product [Rotaria sp. Silwood2]CAF2802586.1 unnamed protein product [Rotaria sp. Silwood2]CAF4158075.1 unnamed protein product [Rotaria sp. Silwood2]